MPLGTLRRDAKEEIQPDDPSAGSPLSPAGECHHILLSVCKLFQNIECCVIVVLEVGIKHGSQERLRDCSNSRPSLAETLEAALLALWPTL